ncbi:MAG: hypothetical protein LBE12_08255, partial [Planctomycetaceae bacterium]|nr:hypothetical protein [Planctomycetaceae bacterium]
MGTNNERPLICLTIHYPLLKKMIRPTYQFRALFDGTTVPVLEQVVNFDEARQALLAGNIANFDTPLYQAR